MRKKQHLSADTLIVIQGVIDTIDAQLDRLHWQILPFLPNDNHKKGANSLDTLKNIQKERNVLQKARTEVGQVFETQFSLKHHAKCSGMSLYEYKKRLKQYELENPLGNSRPMFVKLKANPNKVSSRLGRKG